MKAIKTFVYAFSVILIISLVSAGFSDWITGKATSQPTNVTVSVAGRDQCQVTYVSPISPVNPVELSSTTVTFNVHVYDKNGMNDINKSAVFANFTYSLNGNKYRATVSNCSWINNIPPRTANFSCSIDMWYWDSNGQWDINVRGNDIGNKTPCYNTTTNFQYNQLKALVIYPTTLTWDTLVPEATNQTSNNDPTLVNNTGNYNGSVSITGINLLGETDTSEAIFAENFTVGLTTGAGYPECGASATQLINGTLVSIANSNSNPGNLSEGSGAGQSNYYYCIPEVPLVSSQVYSTLNGGSWIISF